jgi:hypothetical protein
MKLGVFAILVLSLTGAITAPAGYFFFRADLQIAHEHLHPFAGFPGLQPQPHLAHIIFSSSLGLPSPQHQSSLGCQPCQQFSFA